MIEIKPEAIKDTTISVPGSKSYTHRILIAAALSDGVCRIENSLRSEDTLLTLKALRQMGVVIEEFRDCLLVHGNAGALAACSEPIYLGNSGTSMRLLTALAALGRGTYRLTGTPRMQQRPIQDLMDGLNQINVKVQSVNADGCPPIDVAGGRISGGRVRLNCGKSSQYLSALLLTAPYTTYGVEIRVTEGPVSKPYIDMTVAVMEKLGVAIERDGYRRFSVKGGQIYRAGTYVVEPDASQAGYFWAASAITGASIMVKGILKDSRQGDVRFTRLLKEMGCEIMEESDAMGIRGGPLNAIQTDMADMPDLVPTLAVVAAFAKGTTVIRNVAHLKVKESDRLAAVVAELTKMGISAKATDNDLMVTGGSPRGATIETHDDHRIAMSFALAGLKIPGMIILDETCVEKSFPEFWQVLAQLYRI
ncbi:MAG: 3-phosphoshikimate 1-carboxyvinyltransferase [Desulfobacterales bacterium]|nr:3-phosphoshikimate 1-carboxyvinyltransferase [Desulfobacterales bacterium]